ncbi:LNS2 protein, partial [Necator americanus]
ARFFQVANLSPNHRANDVLVVAGSELNVTAKFCYGPMDLAALTRELVSVFVCPQRGDWFEVGTFETDSHGRLMVSLGTSLPCGIHSVKMVVHGDRSYLDSFVAVVPATTRCVVFSVDGSLTASVSVTGKDPRVRPGAVDAVRYWHEQGYVILYLTARPDMQQRVVSAWLAQHCFPYGLLLFNPSFSTDPLKQKSLHLKHIIDMGIRIHAAYGSSKDVAVYCGAGVEQSRIVSVAGSRRRVCVFIGEISINYRVTDHS